MRVLLFNAANLILENRAHSSFSNEGTKEKERNKKKPKTKFNQYTQFHTRAIKEEANIHTIEASVGGRERERKKKRGSEQ